MKQENNDYSRELKDPEPVRQMSGEEGAQHAGVPDWWQTSVEAVDACVSAVRTGAVESIGRSPGGREVRLVSFGDAPEKPLGQCNWNSALGAGQPDAYFGVPSGERRRPALMVIAGMHGAEVEGIAAALSLIRIAETGADLSGRLQPRLKALLDSLRLVIVPLANPDGRVRCPVETWIGRDDEAMSRINHGTRRSGERYGWPACKAVHPMRGDVDQLGGYFDDAGINLMHEFWESPRSPITQGLLRRISAEGPDCLLNLHSCENGPMLLRTAYVPPAVNIAIQAMNEQWNRRLAAAGQPLSQLEASAGDDPSQEVPPAFNFNSMACHIGAQLPVVVESPHGTRGWRFVGDCADLLLMHHLMFEVAAETILGRTSSLGGDVKSPGNPAVEGDAR